MIPPEVQLLLDSIRIRYGSPDADFSARIAGMGSDWDRVLALARIHGVAPLLSAVVAESEGIPDELRSRLRVLDDERRLRNLALAGELVRVVAGLEAAGVQVVPYKGPVLAEAAYGDLALREFVDLDLLVPRPAVPRARDVLLAMGYVVDDTVTARRLRHMLANGHDLKLTRPDVGVEVEIQWQVVDRADMATIPLEPMLERAVSMRLGGQVVPSLSVEDLFLVLCIHGAVHLWERLGWSCDVAELARSAPDLDTSLLLSRARAVGAVRPLLLGVEMAHRVTRAALPMPLLDAAGDDPTVASLAQQLMSLAVARRQGEPDAIAGGRYLRLLLAMRDDGPTRRRQAIRAAVIPTESDWLTLPLPDPLFPLYFVLRPLRLVWDYAVHRRQPGHASKH
jgi:hypothetical protein